MYEMPNSPFEKPAGKPAKKEEPVKTLREKVTEARREQARMTPAEREAEHRDKIYKTKNKFKIREWTGLTRLTGFKLRQENRWELL